MAGNAEGIAWGTSSPMLNALHRGARGHPLELGTRSRMEESFGRDFGDVHIHTDGDAAEAARQLDAHAFTIGHDVYFHLGRYEPATLRGERLLAHELTHVVQQEFRAGRGDRLVNLPTDAAETEAVAVSSQIGQPSRPLTVSPNVASAAVIQRQAATAGTARGISGGTSQVRTQSSKQGGLRAEEGGCGVRRSGLSDIGW